MNGSEWGKRKSYLDQSLLSKVDSVLDLLDVFFEDLATYRHGPTVMSSIVT